MEERAIPISSVRKALALLDRLALGDLARRGVSLSALAREFDWPLNSTHNLVKTLVACGYVRQIGRGLYAAGPKCEQVARAEQCGDARVQAGILEALDGFVEAEGEPCVCVTVVHGRRVMVAAVDGTHAVRVSQGVVEDVPFFGKATGRMLAALADEDGLREILARNGLPGSHWKGVRDEADLRRRLAALRAKGCCVVRQTDADLVAIACPVMRADGRPWGALGTYAPAYRCPRGREVRLRRALERAAARVSGVVSGPAPSAERST